jgi:hypothetical protein
MLHEFHPASCFSLRLQVAGSAIVTLVNLPLQQLLRWLSNPIYFDPSKHIIIQPESRDCCCLIEFLGFPILLN